MMGREPRGVTEVGTGRPTKKQKETNCIIV